MSARRIGLALLLLALPACAKPLPPAWRVFDVRTLAGTYSGSMREVNKVTRPARLVIQDDGRFEITVGVPDGFRTTGLIIVESDGTLSYQYDDVKGKGLVHEGDGRRVIVLTQAGGVATTTVDKSLP